MVSIVDAYLTLWNTITLVNVAKFIKYGLDMCTH